MSESELAELLKYSSPNELWIIDESNHLIILRTPFKVLVLASVGTLHKGDIVLVIEIKITNELITVYIIKNLAFYYYHFDLLIDKTAIK